MKIITNVEVIIGTYDEEPLYRRFIVIESVAKATWTNITFDMLGLDELETLVKYKCKIRNTNNTYYNLPYFLYSSRWGFCMIDTSNKWLQYYYTDTGTTVDRMELEIIYTKGDNMILDKLYPMDNEEHKLGENKYIKHFTGTTNANDRYTIVPHGLTNVSMIHCYGTIAGGGAERGVTPNNKLNEEWDWGMGCDSVNYSIGCPSGSSCRGKTYHVWLIYSKI